MTVGKTISSMIAAGVLVVTGVAASCGTASVSAPTSTSASASTSLSVAATGTGTDGDSGWQRTDS
jgi:basic membrane lipoprotein Med (substrate-binding protein (PBP1-ABC) superfamily)